MLHIFGALDFLENKSYDLRVRLFAPSLRCSDDIVVILVDQNSLDWGQSERGWGWPWPRSAYAEMIDYMNLSGSKSIAFDIIYSEPSVYGPEDDEEFARASRNFGQVVQGIFFSSQSGNVRYWPPNVQTSFFRPEGFGGFLDEFGKGGEEAELTGAVFPLEELHDSAGALGSLTGIRDSDDIYRRLRLFTLFDGKVIPGFGPASLIVSGHDTAVSYNSKNRTIQWGDFTVPVDKNGKSLLRFRGDLDRYTFYTARTIITSFEAYENGEEPLVHPEDLTGAHVFVGLYGPGLYDIFSSPISSQYPGMGMHITMLDNLLNGDFNRESRQWLNLLILFAAVSFTVIISLFSHRIFWPVAGTAFALITIIAASFAAYLWGSLWLPMIMHLTGITAAFGSATLYNYATEGSQKRFIKSAFSQYLSPKVIEQIIADPSQLKLGGEKREMTAIFTDIRGFSTFSEALGDPEKLVELLNFYLTRMSNIILRNEGTIDKYEGDAIIAFFGAPVHMENHASLACRSAVMMKKAEADTNREALEKGLITEAVMQAMAKKGLLRSADDLSPMFTRLGINTGDMVVGNMGTPNKMNYTIMGNAVNLAARLEGVNKQYNTKGILISEYTRAKIGDEFIVRPLSRVRVVGINTPLRLYELLDIREEADPMLREMVKSWEQGFALYERRDFPAAGNIFQAIFRQDGADLAAKMYYDRCRKYNDSPPGELLWDDGIDNLTEK
ncbi:MAG: adenylate/guanylate cyclase domain-containing protein [Treponema sp.]|nr:adenylate/guanylate cyclase domain-containing protein [Treponema sp.]